MIRPNSEAGTILLKVSDEPSRFHYSSYNQDRYRRYLEDTTYTLRRVDYRGWTLVRRGNYLIRVSVSFRKGPANALTAAMDAAEQAAYAAIRQAEGGSDQGEVRFKDVAWAPHEPFLIKAVVQEKMDGRWRPPQEPVYVRAVMTKGARWEQGVPGRHLMAAYAVDWKALASIEGALHFEAPFLQPPSRGQRAARLREIVGDRYTSDPNTGAVGIGLVTGAEMGPQSVWRAAGAKPFKAIHLNGDFLEQLWASLKQNTEDRHEPGKLVGQVALEAYRFDGSGQYDFLARSRQVRVQVDRIAELLVADTRKLVPGAAPLEVRVFREGIGNSSTRMPIRTFESATEYAIGSGLRLVPGDSIQLGQWDYVTVRNLVDGTMWHVAAEQREGKREFHVWPRGVKPPWGEDVLSESNRNSFVGYGVGIVVSSVKKMSSAVSGVVSGAISCAIGSAMDDELTWVRAEPHGTVLGFESGQDGVNVYLIEGAATVRGEGGEPVRVGTGQTVTVTKDSVSQPERFVRAGLPPSLRGGLETGSETIGSPADPTGSRRRFVVALDSTTKEQNDGFREFIKDNGLLWWHWLDDTWLIVDPSGKFTAHDMVVEAMPRYPEVHLLVIQLDPTGDRWSGFGPNTEESNMFEWLQETWGQDGDAGESHTTENRFIVALDSSTVEQNDAFRQFIKDNGLLWWHWLDDFWLIVGSSGGFTAADIRDKAKECFPGVHLLAIRLDENGDRWSGFGPNTEESNMFEWLQETWPEQ